MNLKKIIIKYYIIKLIIKIINFNLININIKSYISKILKKIKATKFY